MEPGLLEDQFAPLRGYGWGWVRAELRALQAGSWCTYRIEDRVYERPNSLVLQERGRLQFELGVVVGEELLLEVVVELAVDAEELHVDLHEVEGSERSLLCDQGGVGALCDGLHKANLVGRLDHLQVGDVEGKCHREVGVREGVTAFSRAFAALLRRLLDDLVYLWRTRGDGGGVGGRELEL